MPADLGMRIRQGEAGDAVVRPGQHAVASAGCDDDLVDRRIMTDRQEGPPRRLMSDDDFPVGV